MYIAREVVVVVVAQEVEEGLERPLRRALEMHKQSAAQVAMASKYHSCWGSNCS